jgi:hypothetical protein
MWTLCNHPGGFGRKYQYKNRDLHRLSCWWYQPSQHVPKGSLFCRDRATTWSSRWTKKELASVCWQLEYVDEHWQLRLTFAANGKFTKQVILMTPDAVAGTSNQRWWWLCPDCKRRCGTLYCIPSSKLSSCRKCGRVTYTEQQRMSPGRSCARLGLPPWPKGMHMRMRRAKRRA